MVHNLKTHSRAKTKSDRLAISPRPLSAIAVLAFGLFSWFSQTAPAQLPIQHTTPQLQSQNRSSDTIARTETTTATLQTPPVPNSSLVSAQEIFDERAVPGSSNPNLDQPTIDEINAIRKRMGGGVTSELSGLFDESRSDSAMTKEQSQTDFERELQRLYAESGNDAPRPANPTQAALPHNGHPLPVAFSTSQSSAPRSAHASQSGRISSENRRHLREAAQLLEQAAAELENVDFYRDSDELRRKAQQLWQRARD